QLAGNVEGHAVRAMRGEGIGEHRGGVFQCGVPVRAAARQRFAQTQFGIQRAGLDIAGQVQGRSLAAQPAEIGWMGGVALYAEDMLVVVFDKHAAADTAVATGRSSDLVHAFGSLVGGPPLQPRAANKKKYRQQADAYRDFFVHPVAGFKDSHTRPFSTLAACRWAQPTSGATASPLSGSICQLCSGQDTRLPNTSPWDNGPPLCGQRSSRAKTSSWAVRKRAMSPLGPATMREPRRLMSSNAQISSQL